VEEIDEMLREAMIRNIRLLPTPSGPTKNRKQPTIRFTPGDEPDPERAPSVLVDADDERSTRDHGAVEAGEVAIELNPRKRRNRQHRGKKSHKNPQEARGEAIPLAFSSDITGDLERPKLSRSNEQLSEEDNDEE